MILPAPVVRLKARWQEVQIGDTPFATVGLAAASRAFGGAAVAGDDVVLLSSLRRLSGGFAEKDMKKEGKKRKKGKSGW